MKCVKCFVCGNVDLFVQQGEVHCLQCEPSIFDEPQEATETVEMEVKVAA